MAVSKLLQRINAFSGGTIKQSVSPHIRMFLYIFRALIGRRVARVGIYEIGVIQENGAEVGTGINGINGIPEEYA